MHAHTSSDLMYPPLCYTLKVFPKPTNCERKYFLSNFPILRVNFFLAQVISYGLMDASD